MKKYLCIVMFILSFVSCLNIHTLAHDNRTLIISLQPPSSATVCGETLSIPLIVESNSSTNLSTFKAQIKFDNTKLEFKKILAADDLSKSDFNFSIKDDQVDFIYLSCDKGINLEPNQKYKLANVELKILKYCKTGSTEIKLTAQDAADNNINEIPVTESSALSINVSDKSTSKKTTASTYKSEKTTKSSSKNTKSSKKSKSSKSPKTSKGSKNPKSSNKRSVDKNLQKGQEVCSGNNENTSSQSGIPANKPSNPKANKTIIVRENSFNSFLVGVIVSGSIAALVYLVYRYRKKKLS